MFSITHWGHWTPWTNQTSQTIPKPMSRTLEPPKKMEVVWFRWFLFLFNLGVFFSSSRLFSGLFFFPPKTPQKNQTQPPLRALTKAVEKRESSRNSPPKATTVRIAYKLSCFYWIKGKPASNGGLVLLLLKLNSIPRGEVIFSTSLDFFDLGKTPQNKFGWFWGKLELNPIVVLVFVQSLRAHKCYIFPFSATVPFVPVQPLLHHGSCFGIPALRFQLNLLNSLAHDCLENQTQPPWAMSHEKKRRALQTCWFF